MRSDNLLDGRFVHLLESNPSPTGLSTDSSPELSFGRHKTTGTTVSLMYCCCVLRKSKDGRSMEPRQLRLPGFTRLWAILPGTGRWQPKADGGAPSTTPLRCMAPLPVPGRSFGARPASPPELQCASGLLPSQGHWSAGFESSTYPQPFPRLSSQFS